MKKYNVFKNAKTLTGLLPTMLVHFSLDYFGCHFYVLNIDDYINQII